MNFALSFRFVEFPESIIIVLAGFPFSTAMLHSVKKSSMKDVSILPHENTILVLRLVIDKISHVDVSPDKLETVPMLTVVLKITLEKSALWIIIDEKPISMKHVVAGDPKIPGIVGFMNVLTFLQIGGDGTRPLLEKLKNLLFLGKLVVFHKYLFLFGDELKVKGDFML